MYCHYQYNINTQYSGTLLLRRLGYYLTLFLLFLLLPNYICEFSNSNAFKKTIWLFQIFTMLYWGSLLGRAFIKDYILDLWPGSNITVLMQLLVARILRLYDRFFFFNLKLHYFCTLKDKIKSFLMNIT